MTLPTDKKQTEQKSGKKSIDDLLAIMAALRDPDTGCDWDKAQSYDSIVPYTIEEAYEVAGAIEKKDMLELRDELGDVLFQTVFYAQIAKEDQHFDFDDVVNAICDKMIRRHPHVFGSKEERAKGMVAGQWEQIKTEERAQKAKERMRLSQEQNKNHNLANNQNCDGGQDTSQKQVSESLQSPQIPIDDAGREPSVSPDSTSVRTSILDDIPRALPALSRAVKLQNRAARVGFDWPSLEPVFDKMREELAELEAEIKAGNPKEEIAAEFGDLMFVMANVARHLDIDPEAALTLTNHKFISRFTRIEELLAEDGRTADESDLEEMDRLWDRAKAEEKN